MELLKFNSWYLDKKRRSSVTLGTFQRLSSHTTGGYCFGQLGYIIIPSLQEILLDKISLDCKEIKPVCPKGNKSWIFIGKTDAETETLLLWPGDEKSWLIGKDPDAGKDWRQEEKRTTEDKLVGWHHRLSGYEFEQAPGEGEEQGSLACCSP